MPFIGTIVIILLSFWLSWVLYQNIVKPNDLQPIEISILSNNDTLSKENVAKIDSLAQKLEGKKYIYANESYLTIERLNSFYATLFTFIAIIIAIITALFALIAWNRMRELKDRLKDFNAIKDDIDFLKRKGDLANWVQEQFDKDNNFILSTKLEIEKEEKWKAIENFVPEDTKDDCWLQLIYAKQKMNGSKGISCTCENDASSGNSFYAPENNHCSCFNHYHEVYKIQKSINDKLALIKDEPEKATFYHMFGQFYWNYYNHKKNTYYKHESETQSDIKVVLKTWEVYDIEDIENPSSLCKPNIILEKSLSFYEKALKIAIDNDETLGNYAVVLSELAKLKDFDKSLLQKAEKRLKYISKLGKTTLNTHWDLSRILFYIDKNNQEKENKDTVKKEIKEAAYIVSSPDTKAKNRQAFVEELELDNKETGFPNDDIDLLNEIKNIVYGNKQK